MTEVMDMPADSLDQRRDAPPSDQRDKSADDADSSPPPPPRRRDRVSRERRDDGDLEQPPNRRGDYYDRNRSPPRERDYKRRASQSPSSPYRERRQSPGRLKRSRRDDGGYDGRRGSGERRYGYDYPSGFERDMGVRPGYTDERTHGRYVGRSSGAYQGSPLGNH